MFCFLDQESTTNPVMSPEDLQIQANNKEAESIMKRLEDLRQQTAQHVAVKKGKENTEKNWMYKNNWLIHTSRKPNAIIKPEIWDLICKNVLSG